jgi:hypothetical protein
MTTDHPKTSPSSPSSPSSSPLVVIVAWLLVGLPLLWGVTQTFSKALALFR